MAAINTITKERMAELLARARAAKAAIPAIPVIPVIPAPNTTAIIPETEAHSTDHHGNAITYNAEQLAFIHEANQGNSCILIGAAGTGKTTTMKGTMLQLIQSGRIRLLSQNMSHKFLKPGMLGVAVCACTRRATNNIRKNLPQELQPNAITIHKLLEYKPVIYESIDADGNSVKTRIFEPKRNQLNPISSEIRVIVLEEASMISVELFQQILAATPHNPTFIFLGDIQQLPPVFGSAILGYKMLELPTIELTQVYRQALESPIIRLAHRILSGKAITAKELPEWAVPDQLKLHPWKKKLHPDIALLTIAKFFTLAIDAQSYNPEEDIILIPYKKAFGSDELNKHIAQHIAHKSGNPVYEIIAGFNKHYYAVGDKVLYDKEDAIIHSIAINPLYSGKAVQAASPDLDYWGFNNQGAKAQDHHIEISDDQMDFLLEQAASTEERVKQASHIITLHMQDSERTETLDTASALNALALGYAITVHKSQGSEWNKVFLVLHQSHATMLQRELLYTAVTRAKKELYVICDPESFVKGIESQRIKGNTLAEKCEYFKGKQDRGELQR